ncbi:MAG: NADH-quinone oxidoreductase subunit J, partial [Rhodoferax sp.]|nr:NADH-quinone oxidoreductase subunit J [Rhodoferax sp.]
LAAAVGVVIALEMAAVLLGGFRVIDDPAAANNAIGGLSNTQQLGKLLYTEYIYPLEIAAAILLVAMIAAIALTLRARKDSKYVSPGDQVRVKAQDRMTVLKMDATQEAPAPAPPEAAAPPETKA